MHDGRLGALVLAAGKGTRMHSELPKVLQPLLGEPMLWYTYEALLPVVSKESLWTVVGHGSQRVESLFPKFASGFILQEEQLGTGHALQCACPSLRESRISLCLIVNGDAPLLTPQSMEALTRTAVESEAELTFLSLELDDPSGYGRIVRDGQGYVRGIVEDKDIAEDRVRSIREVNAGMYCVNLEAVQPYLDRLSNDNRQGEYYLPELIDLLVADGKRVETVCQGPNPEFLGINTPKDLIHCEAVLQERIVSRLLEQGVIIRNPQQARIGPKVEVQPGADLTGPLELYGACSVAGGCSIESHVWMRDVAMEASCRVRSFSHLEEARIGEGVQVGPYARIRPGTELRTGSRVGNFVEVKKSVVGEKSKVNHLTYIGDTRIGRETNVGAGTITCNYDGRSKHETVIGDRVFIGSNTALVAPVTIGDASLIGAGSTITKDVPQSKLAVGRSKQRNLDLKKAPTQDT